MERSMKCEFVDYTELSYDGACGVLSQPLENPTFGSEAEYADWFVEEALPQLAPHLQGCDVWLVEREKKIPGGRVDVLAHFENDRKIAFELKNTNRKNPQTHAFSFLSGVGQALYYQDVLTAMFGATVPVFLTADRVTEQAMGVIVRHGLFVSMIEANRDRIVCVANPHKISPKN